MQTQAFDRSFDDLTASLGDPTRRGIYVMVRESADPVTAGSVAEAFGIHPNVARHHLDRLVDGGFLRVADRLPTRGAGAGRPAKQYEATDKEILLSYPARRYDLLAELLVRVIERIAPEHGPTIAEEVGREYGLHLASEVALPDEEGGAEALSAVARAMMGVGFGITPDEGDRLLLTSHCPFGSAAARHPAVVCRLDQGIVRGLMDAIGPAAGTTVTVTPHTDPDEACITEV